MVNKKFNTKEEIETEFYRIGVVVSSGYGDGCYPVIAKIEKETGRIKEIRIEFSKEEKMEEESMKEIREILLNYKFGNDQTILAEHVARKIIGIVKGQEECIIG